MDNTSKGAPWLMQSKGTALLLRAHESSTHGAGRGQEVQERLRAVPARRSPC